MPTRASARSGAGASTSCTTQLYTFALDASKHELVSLRAIVAGTRASRRCAPSSCPSGRRRCVGRCAASSESSVVCIDGAMQGGQDLRRAPSLRAGQPHAKAPPSIAQMDSTTLILPGHVPAKIDAVGQHPDPTEHLSAQTGGHHHGRQRSSRPIRTPFKTVELDSITLDIIENALRNARFEMDAVLFRTAMSPGIREQHDAFPLIANNDGKMIVGQFGSFIHGFVDGYDGTIEEGDIFLTNDPVLVQWRDQPSERLAGA
jgi:hypothetical protein